MRGKRRESEIPDISIIVPIYNAERYLIPCLESIVNQTRENIEIILIDDGSVDNSATICKEYAKKDERIIYFYQNNSGLVAARKKGLELAQADYIGFVDSDDWIEPDEYNYCLNIIQTYGCDAVSFGHIREYENGKKSTIICDNFEEGLYTDLDQELYPAMIHDFTRSHRGMDSTLWCRVFKRDVLKKVYEGFDSRIFYGEDALIYAYLLSVRSVYVSHKIFYHYRIHEDSMCFRINPNMVINNHLLYQYLAEYIKKSRKSEILLLQLKRYMIELEMHNLQYLYGINLKAFSKWNFEIDEEVINSQIILYGAGYCGQAIYKKMLLENTGQVVAWIDANTANKELECGREVFPPDYLLNKLDFDYLLIATESENVAEEIRKNCIEKYHIAQEKIKWAKSSCALAFD